MSDVPTLEQGIALFNRREFFDCHEVLEDLWRPLPEGDEKTFLQGVLQVAVGYHHLLKGNFIGAKNKLFEGLEKLEATAESEYRSGIELGAFFNAVQFSYQCLITLGGHRVGDFPEALIPAISLKSSPKK